MTHTIDKLALARALSTQGGLLIKGSYVPAYMFFQTIEDIDDKYKAEVESRILEMSGTGVNLVAPWSLDSNDIPDNSIAYIPVFGPIYGSRSEYRFRFSSVNFVNDLMMAQSNPKISSIFLHLSTGGGDAWYLDRVASCMQAVDKPIHAHIERACYSAGYYIASNATTITAETPNCGVGSIGVLCMLYDDAKFWENIGVKLVTLYASQSDLKNKKVRDAINDEPEKFIKEELDPLAAQFVQNVRTGRSALADLPDDDPIFRGEDFSASVAVENGLIDGVCSIAEALSHAQQAGEASANTRNMRAKALNSLL